MAKKSDILGKVGDPSNLLALAEKEYKEKLAELEAAHISKTQKLLSGVKVALADGIKEVVDIFNSIPTEARKTVLSEPAYEMMLGILGLEVRQEKVKGTRKPRSANAAKVSDDQILAFIAEEEKMTSDIQNHFKFSPVTVGNRLKALEAGKKLKHRKDGVKKLWKKV